MSIKLMSEVWTLEVSRSEQTILLALADWADDSGQSVRPSVALLAWKTDFSERAIQSWLKKFRTSKALIVVRKASQHRPTEYRLDLSVLPKKTPYIQSRGAEIAPLVSAESEKIRGEESAPLNNPEVQTDPSRGAESDVRGEAAAAPNPSVEPSISDPSNAASDKKCTTRDIQDAYLRVTGLKATDVSWAAGEADAAKFIAHRWTVEQFERGLRFVQSQKFWQDKRISLRYLKGQMPVLVKINPGVNYGNRTQNSIHSGNNSQDAKPSSQQLEAASLINAINAQRSAAGR